MWSRLHGERRLPPVALALYYSAPLAREAEIRPFQMRPAGGKRRYRTHIGTLAFRRRGGNRMRPWSNLMKQILAVLAPVTWLALATTFGVGLTSQALGGLRSADGSIYVLHFTLGLFSVLCALGVHCLIFIYFLGTGRWVKEVALAYGIPDDPLPKLTRDLKRRTFPPALFAMLIAIATASAGAAVQWRDWHWTIHLSLAVATLAINAWAFWVEHRNVTINVGIIDDVMREVDRIRARYGMPSNAEAMRQEQI